MPRHARVDPKRKAVAVAPAAKKSNLRRLARIEGQVRGLARMIEGESYCPDVIAQVHGVVQALRAVSRDLLREHIAHCAAHHIASGQPRAEAAAEEIADLAFRWGK